VGIIILIEQIDDIVRTPEKVNQATGLSTLMTIAYLPTIAKHFPQLRVYEEDQSNGHHQVSENGDTIKLDPAAAKQARLLMRRWDELKENTSQEAVGLVNTPETLPIEDPDETTKPISTITKQDIATRVDSKVRDKASKGYRLPEEFLTLGVLLSDESVQLAAKGSKIRTLLITSAENGDGKTSIASQVALGLARIGTQVVLVDASMRKPEVRNVFNLSNRVGLSNRPGLSSILTGNGKVETSPLFDALQKTDEPDLTMLPSGPVVDSLSGLLSSSRMTAVLNLLSEKALVVIDGPAVLTSSDAVILAKKCDSVLMVADARRTSASKLKQAFEILTQMNVCILGVILNRANKE
jgi:capsular exopolysaccharide synthesis family protein